LHGLSYDFEDVSWLWGLPRARHVCAETSARGRFQDWEQEALPNESVESLVVLDFDEEWDTDGFNFAARFPRLQRLVDAMGRRPFPLPATVKDVSLDSRACVATFLRVAIPPAAATLQRLSIDGASSTLVDLAPLKQCVNLQSLELYGCKRVTSLEDTLRALPRLTELTLPNTADDEAVWPYAVGHPALRTVRAASLTPAAVVALAAGCPRLHRIELRMAPSGIETDGYAPPPGWTYAASVGMVKASVVRHSFVL
jgi:hypothetical protein